MSYPVRRSVVVAAVVTALAALGAAPVRAQGPAPAPAPLPPRIGWELGFGLYGGDIRCENQNGDFCNGVTEAGGFDLHANYFWRPKLGVTFDVWPMVHTENDWTFTHDIATVGLKWRPVPILTLQGGIGSAQAHLTYNRIFGFRADTETVAAVMFGAALEIVRSRKWSLDLQARIGNGFYSQDNNGDGKPDIKGTNIGVGAAMTFF